MIVKPTVNELLEHADNRFALVIATSRRARQIAKGDKKLTKVDEESPVTIAANEINEGKVTICKELEESAEVTEEQENTEEE
jgi:DNA-directed RNA polymerase subunit omega